jgi:hypothetical protein
MLKSPSKYERDTSEVKIHNFLRQFLLTLVGMPESSGGRNRSFPCQYLSTVALLAITWGMNSGLVDDSNSDSLTP